MQILKAKILFGAAALGIFISLATGFTTNEQGMSIPEIRHYGYPLAWLTTNLNGPNEYLWISLALDAVFWVAVSLLVLISMEMIILRLGMDVSLKSFLLPLALFVPLSVVMDFVHELGHVMWATAVGGRLAYMKIAYLEIYPRFSLTPTFVLGLVSVDGLTTRFAHGFFLLGGSVTTTMVAWFSAILLLKRRIGHNKRVVLKILSLLGFLDLPFYVIFPQLGLQHWIFLGGSTPEPLVGAREMGIPDLAFYVMIGVSTLVLLCLYFRSFREKGWNMVKSLLTKLRNK